MRIHHAASAALKGTVPFASRLRSIKRGLVPYSDNAANTGYCLEQGLEMIGALRESGVAVEGRTVLEFGTGWLPVIPLLFHLAGARRLVLTDIERLMDRQTIARARSVVDARLEEVAAALGLEPEAARERLHRAPFQTDYLVPWEASAHEADEVDIVVSRAVFEHIPEAPLRLIVGEFRRILRADGAMCHCVDLSDHWQHGDRGLSRVDFLRYDDEDWRWRLAQASPFAFQNRLRHSDYQRLLREAGFTVLMARGQPDAGCLSDLQSRVEVANRFRSYHPADLATLTTLYTAVPG